MLDRLDEFDLPLVSRAEGAPCDECGKPAEFRMDLLPEKVKTVDYHRCSCGQSVACEDGGLLHVGDAVIEFDGPPAIVSVDHAGCLIKRGADAGEILAARAELAGQGR